MNDYIINRPAVREGVRDHAARRVESHAFSIGKIHFKMYRGTALTAQNIDKFDKFLIIYATSTEFNSKEFSTEAQSLLAGGASWSPTSGKGEKIEHNKSRKIHSFVLLIHYNSSVD